MVFILKAKLFKIEKLTLVFKKLNTLSALLGGFLLRLLLTRVFGR